VNASLFALLRRTYLALPERFRSRAIIACVLLVLQSLAELLSLGAIIPAVPALMAPETFFHRGFGARIAGFVGIESLALLSLLLLTGIVVLFALKNLFVYFVNRYQVTFVYDVYRDLSTRLYEHHLASGLLALRSRPSPEVARDIVGVTNRFAGTLVLAFLLLLTEIVVILMLSAGIVWYEPFAFAVVACGLFPLFGLFYLRTKRAIQKIELQINNLDARLAGTVYQSLFGYADVVATGAQGYFLRRYSRMAAEYGHALGKRTIFGFVPARLSEVAMVVGVAILYFYAVLRIPELPARLTLFGVYLVAAYRLLPSGNRMTISLLAIRGNAFALDVVEAMQGGLVSRDLGPGEAVSFEREISFENVSFRYPNAKAAILENVSVTVKKGECLGIMGPSGTGKSTFLNLFLGLLEPTAGVIRVDGSPLKPSNIEAWRRLTGYVQQEVFILDGTILENIAFGVEDADVKRERVDRAVRLSALTELIGGFPKGLLTPVGERGSTLSVGQKQRLGIARALYHGAEVIVFDEATSALDAETEKEITSSIRNLGEAGCTVIIVSHREQPLTVCDRVTRLENGNLRPHTIA
jgi:ABC-type multidrug transport system fused ATPase/permease subunit